MKQTVYEGIIVSHPDEMVVQEALLYVNQEIESFAARQKKLSSVSISLVADEVEIKSVEKSRIKRLRRITGYLSNVDNFNDAKQAEYKDRVNHM